MYQQDKRKTLLKLIENSIGSRLFRNNYFFVNGKSKDIVKDGELSCAFYITTILKILGLIKEIHLTVDSTLKDMKKSGWYKIKKPKKGAVVLWDKNKNGHYHLGFYWGKNIVVSNSTLNKAPVFHSLDYHRRKILAFYYHKELEK
jgi:hypothetical protein